MNYKTLLIGICFSLLCNKQVHTMEDQIPADGRTEINEINVEEIGSFIINFLSAGFDEDSDYILDTFSKIIDNPRPNIDLIKQCFKFKLIDANKAFSSGSSRPIYPVYLLIYNFQKHNNYEDLKDILNYLQTHCGWDINAEIDSTIDIHKSPLCYITTFQDSRILFTLLLDLGANPELPFNKFALQYAKDYDNKHCTTKTNLGKQGFLTHAPNSFATILNAKGYNLDELLARK